MNELSGASVLVVGGAGFVGSNLVAELLDRGAGRVDVVDNFLSSEPDNLPSRPTLTVTEGSIADDGVVSALGDDYDFAFHLATFHGNQNSIHDPLRDHEHNQLATLKLFDRLKGFKRLRKVVYSGAGCAVAAKTDEAARATTEDEPVSLHMDSPYSISKLVGEFYAVYYHSRHRLPAVRARFQNVYGPGEVLGAGRWRGTPATVWRNVVPTFVYKSLKSEALPLEGGGRSTRDFVFVGDIVKGLLLCAVNGVPGDVYNLASGVETSIADLAAQIDEITGNPTPPQMKPGRDWDRSGRRFGSVVKSEREIGFRAATTIAEGLQVTVRWARANVDRIDACIRRHAAQLASSV